MKCPRCGAADTQVVDSRERDYARYRRRRCAACGARFPTTEIPGVRRLSDELPLLSPSLVKKSGRVEYYQRAKLHRSILVALRKSGPAAAAIADEITVEIERQLAAAQGAVATRQIGEMALMRLRRSDPTAYIRYASVHLEFETPADFIRAVRALDAAAPPEE